MTPTQRVEAARIDVTNREGTQPGGTVTVIFARALAAELEAAQDELKKQEAKLQDENNNIVFLEDRLNASESRTAAMRGAIQAIRDFDCGAWITKEEKRGQLCQLLDALYKTLP